MLPTIMASLLPISETKGGDPTRSPKRADDAEPTMPVRPPTASSSGSVTDKVISSAANLAQLLPTGTVLAYQALSPSFTNHGTCLSSNRWLTATLVTVLSTFCVFFSFTDSILGKDGKLYYGVATPHRLNVFNFSSDEEKREWTAKTPDGSKNALEEMRLRPMDFVHAFFTAVLFLAVVFSDVGLQNCFFPGASRNTNELLKNLPLGMAFLSSFVFTIFPTTRKGIGCVDTTPIKKAS